MWRSFLANVALLSANLAFLLARMEFFFTLFYRIFVHYSNMCLISSTLENPIHCRNAHMERNALMEINANSITLNVALDLTNR